MPAIKKAFNLLGDDIVDLSTENDQEDSWYSLTTGIVHQDKPAIFGPKEVTPVARHSLTGSQDAGTHTKRTPWFLG